jgi:type II secretory pathway pseudopilin PulG
MSMRVSARWIALIGVLAAGVLWTMGSPSFVHGKSDVGRARAQMESLLDAIRLYRRTYGSYPSSFREIREKWGNLGTVDPWGSEIQFTVVRTEGGMESIRIMSAGPDRTANTADDVVVVTRLRP